MRNDKKTRRKLYMAERRKGNRASYALRSARVHIAWDKANGHSTYDGERIPCYDPRFRDVRLRIVADESADLDSLFGDTYSQTANSDIPLSRLERERKAEIDRVNRDGVCGVIGEYFDGETWQHADSCFGFIGDDWKDSGYDVDIMSQTLDAARKAARCKSCGRPLSQKGH
jgi:hypothetical protein